MNRLLGDIGTRLARYLAQSARGRTQITTTSPERLAATLEPGDVLLVEGNTRFSVAIKYLTQSTWSHAALYVGGALDSGPAPGNRCGWLVEADIIDGVRCVGLDAYAGLHTRICRPIGLSIEDRRKVIDYALARIGDRYDLKHIVDLARYLFPTPPVPVRWRRRLLALGSGDPTRAICSTLIAQAFQSVRYPILPSVTIRKSDDPACLDCFDELLHIRHHSLFVPRDFDVSPYFQVVKPTIAGGFDYRALTWVEMPEGSTTILRVE